MSKIKRADTRGRLPGFIPETYYRVDADAGTVERLYIATVNPDGSVREVFE